MRPFLFPLAIFLAFALILLPTGQERLPAGICMILTLAFLREFKPDAFWIGLLISWIGFACFFIAPWVVRSEHRLGFTACGVALFLTTWTCLFVAVTPRDGYLVRSIPFLILVCVWSAVSLRKKVTLPAT